MASYSFSAPSTLGEWYAVADANWFRLLVAVTVALVSITTAYLFSAAPFYIHKDSALFQHAGWWITEGATLYVDIWDLKPPLIYFVTTLLALVSFGNMEVLHVLGISVAVASVVVGVVLVGVLVHRLTDDGVAALVAGLSMFVLTSIYAFPVAGIRPKYLAFCCGAAGLLLTVDDRPFFGGLVGAAAAGFWQLGAPIALLVVGMSLQRGGGRGALRAIGGGLTMTALTVLPFALNGTLIPLFVEAVIAPIYGVEQYVLDARLLKLLIQVGPGVALIPLGVLGWGWALAADDAKYWWVAVGGVAYLGQIFLEFQGAIELVFPFMFLALGVGLLASYAELPSRQAVVAGCVVVLIVTSASWNVAGPQLKTDLQDTYDEWDVNNYESLPEDPEGWPSMGEIYWEKQTPEYCHYRLGVKQQYFEQATGGTLYKTTCGQWPFAEPPAQWLVDKAVPF